MNPETIRREIHPEVRIIDANQGICDYVASDETLDYYQEVIRVNGWQFTNFKKNSPFVDSHDYSTIEKCLGRVIDFKIEGGKLVERVQWAKDIPDSLAELGWQLTAGGFLKAVSVGFYTMQMATRWDADKTSWLQQLKELNLHEEDGIRCVYIKQEQLELSSCIIGANPNALAKSLQMVAAAYKGGTLNEESVSKLSLKIAKAQSAQRPEDTATGRKALRRKQAAILLEIQRTL